MSYEERKKILDEAESFAMLSGYKYEKTEEEKLIDEEYLTGKISLEEWQRKNLEIIKSWK